MNTNNNNNKEQQNTSNTPKHCHFQKKWMVYNKEDVIDKINESLDSILKYFKATFDENKKIIENLHLIEYIQSRIENISNLLASLHFHDEINTEEYEDCVANYLMIREEFEKPIDKINLKERLNILQDYIDSVLDLSIYDDENEEEDNDNEDDDELPNSKDISSEDIPDNISIINVNSDSKKRKM